MGQKVSPKAFRLKFNQHWDSLWFSDKQYGKQLVEDVKIRKMIADKLKTASVAQVIIDRNANQISVSIYSSKPGVLIGRSGAGSEKIKEMLEKINNLGIGPGGLGGSTTALAVNINTYPTHIAGLPVAVNICCHVNRHVVKEL